MNNGNRNNNNKNNNNNYVRPVLAYLVKNIIMGWARILFAMAREASIFFIKKGLPTAFGVLDITGK